MRRKLIWAAIICGAGFYIFAFFAGDKTWLAEKLRLRDVETELSRGINVLITMAIGLGIINLFYLHGANLLKRRKEWPFSAVVFVTFGVVTGFLLWQYRINELERGLQAETAEAVSAYTAAFAVEDPTARDRALQQLPEQERELAQRYYEYQATYRFQPRKFYLDTFISPLAATVMSLLGFYITYAAYRAFRIRSLEATVMMLSAALVIIGSDPLGNWLSLALNSWLGGATVIHLPNWADLDNRVMNSGMQRGLWIGISVAIIAVSARILLGFEKGLLEVRRGEE
jgi:hypothetical protein